MTVFLRQERPRLADRDLGMPASGIEIVAPDHGGRGLTRFEHAQKRAHHVRKALGILVQRQCPFTSGVHGVVKALVQRG